MILLIVMIELICFYSKNILFTLNISLISLLIQNHGSDIS